MTNSSEYTAEKNDPSALRYAVVGLGYIAQAAVLPAFTHARENSRVTALISGDPVKLRRLGRKYRVKSLFGYDEYDRALRSGEFDAVYIALPNSMHAEYSVQAARERIHVLCEKPMATSTEDCQLMISAAREADVRLMIAYRLHFEATNLEAIEIAHSGKLGELRLFASVFSMNVKPGDIRLQEALGGGPLFDIGIYCINASRYLFRAEPIEVHAVAAATDDERFCEVPEMVCATLRFPQERLATFTCSFSAGDISAYRLVGTEGSLLVEPAYELASGLKYRLTIGDRKQEKKFRKRDQFAPELVHFSDCVLFHRDPGPSAEEGLADVQIIEALRLSAQTHQTIHLTPVEVPSRPGIYQEMHKPAVTKPNLVHAKAPAKGGD